MDCKYCSGEVSNLPIESTLRYVEGGGDYIFIGLKHGSYKLNFKPSIRFESEASGKVCRTKLEVNYCPMCGRKL